MCGSSIDRTVSLDTLPLHPENFFTLLDPGGVIQYESPSIERVLGYDRDKLIGNQFINNVHPDDREQVAEMVQLLTAEQAESVEALKYRHEQADGSYAWVKSTASTEPTDDGHYLINTTELSGPKEHERDLETTDERLYEFAKVVSHDLRNPLNVASGNVELVYRELDSESGEKKETLEKAMRAHERMGTLIQDLLTLVQSGGQIGEEQWIGFPALCERCWQNVSTADATVVLKVSGEVRADRSRLQQLLENLIRNAVEHGGEDVTVTIGDLDAGDGFYVADDGPGIERSALNRVFDSGFSTSTGGTGFGLAIVSEIVEAHGWRVNVCESQAGGARFEVSGVERR